MSDDALRELAKVDAKAAKLALENELRLPAAIPVEDLEDDGFVTVFPAVFRA